MHGIFEMCETVSFPEKAAAAKVCWHGRGALNMPDIAKLFVTPKAGLLLSIVACWYSSKLIYICVGPI